LLGRLDALEANPGPSKFAGMEKSAIALMKTQLLSGGGQEVRYTKQLAASLLQKSVITQEQHVAWKRTGVLPAPAGINLN
jgi:hypothetical protein